MKNREIIERVQSLYSKGAASDDTRLSSRHIYSKLISARSLLLKRELDRKKKLSDRSVEYLECIALEAAKKFECGFDIPLGCYVLKTKCEIPKPINSNYGDYITSVSTIDGSFIFSKTSWERLRYINGNKYTKKTPSYYFKNNYMYLYVPSEDIVKNLKLITIGGVFEDSLGFKCTNECNPEQDCSSYLDKEFVVEDHLIDPIVQLTYNELVNLFIAVPEDRENNTSEIDKNNGSTK
jgi:hypothetical protein